MFNFNICGMCGYIKVYICQIKSGSRNSEILVGSILPIDFRSYHFGFLKIFFWIFLVPWDANKPEERQSSVRYTNIVTQATMRMA